MRREQAGNKNRYIINLYNVSLGADHLIPGRSNKKHNFFLPDEKQIKNFPRCHRQTFFQDMINPINSCSTEVGEKLVLY